MAVYKPYVVILLALFWLSACQESPSQKATVETIEGVEYVHNPATPLHPGRAVSFVEELVIGTEDETGKIYLYQPGPFTVDANHRVYVSDRSDQTIKVFDQNGVYLRSIGAKGKGPGEFLQIGDLAVLPDGKLLVMDFGNRRTSLFRPDGEHLQSCTWPTFLFRLFLTTDSSFTAGETTFAAQERQQLVKTFDFTCNELLSYGRFTAAGVSIKKQGKMAIAIPQPYAPRSIFAGDPQRHYLYHCMNRKYAIEVFDRQGTLFRKIDRPYEPVPFTDEDKQKFLSGFEKSADKVFRQMVKEVEFPKIKTVAARLLVDDAGNLWVATNETKEKNAKTATAYDIFDPHGFYAAKVWTNVRPTRFVQGKAYSLVVDETTELPTIRRYQVEWHDEAGKKYSMLPKPKLL